MDATLCRTKAGRGFKIVIDGKWLYTSNESLLRVIREEANSCRFRSIEDEEDDDLDIMN